LRTAAASGILAPLSEFVFYNLQRQWLAVKYCDETEEYSPSELAVIYYSELLPSAFFLAFYLGLPVWAAAHVGSVCSSLTVLSGAVSVDLKLCSLLDQVAYSVDALSQLGPVLACMINAKPAVY
jgi:hypothetical protein